MNEIYCLTLRDSLFEKRRHVLEAIRLMGYGQAYNIKIKLAWELFPPRPKPAALEVAVDIGAALSAKRGQYVSQLPPDDEPVDPLAVLQRIIGDEYYVDSGMWGGVDEVMRVSLPVVSCPACQGTGYVLETGRQPVTPAPSVEAGEMTAHHYGQHLFNESMGYTRQACDHPRTPSERFPVEPKTHNHPHHYQPGSRAPYPPWHY